MKIVLLALLVLHGLVHLMGFVTAFDIGNIAPFSREIAKSIGILWLTVALLFITSAVLFFLQKDAWIAVGIIAAIVSQILIIMIWQDAKFGTVANVLIIVAAGLSWGTIHFERKYRADLSQNQHKVNTASEQLLAETDLQHLPDPVAKYLRYVGVVNKPKVKNVRIVFEGQMRDKGKDYFPFTSEQYNYFDEPTRLFFMKGKMFGITVPGYHKYSNARASMDIELFGLIPIVKKSGSVMDKTETVTVFNDMCLLAPATLIDKRIQWETINDTSVKAIFTNSNISISAILYFNPQGQLIDFSSDDRTSISDMKQYTFTTPISQYRNINGFNLAHHGEAIWHYPDGNFTYGKFRLKELEYNIQ